jgi:drug/metabolite transporter (DMT)-like permease
LTEAVIVLAIHPAATTIAAKISLKEPCGLLHIVSLLTSLIGVLLSVRLPELFSKTRDNTRFDYMYLGGLASAIAVVIFLTFTFVALRKLKHFHYSVPMLYVGFVGMIENGVINFTTTDIVYPRCGWDTIILMVIGVLGFLSQLFFTLALQVEAAGIIAVFMSTSDIVVAMILQSIFLDDDIDIYNISGACLVILSVSIIGLNKWLHMLPEESKARSKLKWLM